MGICFIKSEVEYWDLILEGTPEQKELATKNLATASELRSQRSVIGAMPSEFTLSEGQKSRNIHDAASRHLVPSQLPGKAVRREGQGDTGDLAVDNAYKFSGITYDFYDKVFLRHSIDNNFMSLIITVHYDRGFDNAFWNGTQMVFGDGLGQSGWNNPTGFLDIMGHELTHGVVDRTAGLEYRRQSGALNESFADVMGSCIKQYSLGQNADVADWLIGDGIYQNPRPHGTWLRSLKEPTKKILQFPGGQPTKFPGHMDDFVETDLDAGGVHINSGIPNRAFYITATEIGGKSWEKAGMIWYRALLEKLTKLSQFKDAAIATIEVAGNLFGKSSKEEEAVRKGWETVGVYK